MKIIFLVIAFFTFLYGDFTRSGDVVRNNHSELEWQDDTIGTTKKWRDAIDYCSTLTLGGESDWRLPNIIELKSIVDRSRQNPAIVPEFLNTDSNQYWSSTTYDSDKTLAWIVVFSDGKAASGLKTYNKRVRCVRGGQQ